MLPGPRSRYQDSTAGPQNAEPEAPGTVPGGAAGFTQEAGEGKRRDWNLRAPVCWGRRTGRGSELLWGRRPCIP